jgi:hypothetical protein
MALGDLANRLTLQGGRVVINPDVRRRVSRVGRPVVTLAPAFTQTLPKTAGSHLGRTAGKTYVTRSAFPGIGHAVGPAPVTRIGLATVPAKRNDAIKTLPGKAGTNLLRVAGTTTVTKSAKTYAVGPAHLNKKGTTVAKHHHKKKPVATTSSALTGTDYLIIAAALVGVWYFFLRK